MVTAAPKPADQINVQVSDDDEFTTLIHDITEPCRQEFSISESLLPKNRRLFIRMRYITFPGKLSPWSETIVIRPSTDIPVNTTTPKVWSCVHPDTCTCGSKVTSTAMKPLAIS